MEFDVIVLDPPWDYYGDGEKMGAAGKEYALMPNEGIWELDIRSRLNRPGVVFLWATGPKLDVAMTALYRWNLHYRGVAFVWVKTRKNGVPIKAQGVRPSIVKPITEMVLVGSTSKVGRPLPLADESICQTVFAPKRGHSQKPEEVQDRIERMYPDATKLEMFARRHRPGWSCEGLEL